MNVWLENSKKNLLALSEEKQNFIKAIQEWFFTGEIIDYHLANEMCELCEKDELRYHFEIRNKIDNYLLVGSKCIEKFDITVIDNEGNEIKENKNLYLQKQARIRHVDQVLNMLSKSNSTETIQGISKKKLDEYCISTFEWDEKLDPKMLNYMFLRFDEEKIQYDKRFFAISIRSNDNKAKLLKLDKIQFDRIKGALSISQRNFYEQNKT
jgi:hypothetical protein